MQVNTTRPAARGSFAPISVNLVLESQAELDAIRQTANWNKPISHKITACIETSKKPDRAFDINTAQGCLKKLYANLKKF